MKNSECVKTIFCETVLTVNLKNFVNLIKMAESEKYDSTWILDEKIEEI